MSAKSQQVGGTHYTEMAVQPWDVIDTWPIDQQIGYYRGNVLKYTMRMGLKDIAAGEIGKAQHYAQKLLEVMIKAENHIVEPNGMDHIPDAGKMIQSNCKLSAFIQSAIDDIDVALAKNIDYSDTGYTEQDMQAASLVHDALRWAMTTHSNDDADWIEHAGKGCPLDDQDTLIHIKVASGDHYDAMPAEYANFLLPIGHEERITHWRYANKEQK